MNNIKLLKNISAESIYGKILEECPSKEFEKLFSNYPYIPKENPKINQDTMDQLVDLIESKVDTLDVKEKEKFISCMTNLGYNNPNNLFSETIYNNFIENSNELVEKIKKHFQDLETKETSILLVPDEIQRFTNKNQINKEKDYCKKRYLRMINIYSYNKKIFSYHNDNLKNNFIELMKYLGIPEPIYLNSTYIFSYNIEDIKEALNNGANINIKNNYGETPLHFAIVFNRSIKIIELLLEKGANINIQDRNGNTPLYFAISINKPIEIIKFLLEKGAKPNIQNNNGDTPLDLAKEKNNEEVVQLFREYSK